MKQAPWIVSCAKGGGLILLGKVHRRSVMRRRHLLTLFAVSLLWRLLPRGRRSAAETFEISKTDAEWKAALTLRAVCRDARGRPPSAPGPARYLTSTARASSPAPPATCRSLVPTTKFDSGTGWPSFFDVSAERRRQKEDNTLFTTRTEVHCRRCGGHLGHVFEDGPHPLACAIA